MPQFNWFTTGNPHGARGIPVVKGTWESHHTNTSSTNMRIHSLLHNRESEVLNNRVAEEFA